MKCLTLSRLFVHHSCQLGQCRTVCPVFTEDMVDVFFTRIAFVLQGSRWVCVRVGWSSPMAQSASAGRSARLRFKLGFQREPEDRSAGRVTVPRVHEFRTSSFQNQPFLPPSQEFDAVFSCLFSHCCSRRKLFWGAKCQDLEMKLLLLCGSQGPSVGRRGWHIGSRSARTRHRQPRPLRYRALGGHPALHGGFTLCCCQPGPGPAAGSCRPHEKVHSLDLCCTTMFDPVNRIFKTVSLNSKTLNSKLGFHLYTDSRWG